MKTFRHLLFAGFMVLCFLVSAPGEAKADAFDTLKQILDVVHMANNQVPSGAQIQAAEDLINWSRSRSSCSAFSGTRNKFLR